MLGIMARMLSPSSADVLINRQLLMSTAGISATAEYKLAFSLPSSSTYGSLVLEVCSNDPIPGNPCVVPPGFDLSGAQLVGQSGATGFSILPGATSNRLVIGRPPAVAPAGAVTYDFQQVVNPSSPGSYYLRLSTYASADGSGTMVDEGGLAFASVNALSVTATVPPYLTFCTGITIGGLNCANSTGDYIDFGELSSLRASSGSSQMLAATNAENGYNITVSGTTMTSGTNIIAALASNDVSRPGTAQFGLNLRANTAPSGGADPLGPGVAVPQPTYDQPNSYRFNDGDLVVSNSVPDDVRLYTASYIVNVPKSQAPGVYVSTLTYICLGTF